MSRQEFEAAYYRIAVSYNKPSGQVPLPRNAMGQYVDFDVEEAWRFYCAGALDMRERAAKAVAGIGDVGGNWPDAAEGDRSNVRAARTIMQDTGNEFAAAIRALPVE